MQLFGFLIVASLILNFGSCDINCRFERVGPNCQFNNIAYGKESRHESNISPAKYSYLANDDSLSTCSYTSVRNTAAPWWNLWLPNNIKFKKLEFVTLKTHLTNFINFKVTVHNSTKSNFENRYLEDTGITCYQHNNYSPQNTKIQVTCDGSPVGNLIRLQLYSSRNQLVLCDFRLYEDCKDGFYGNGCENCSDNCYPSDNRHCDLNDGRCLYCCNSGWKGYHCKINCESGTWGRDCRHECGKCDISDCDIMSGFCKNGCSAGFKLPYCSTECDSGYYGKNCSSSCSTKCDNSRRNPVCNKKDGTCTDGCKAGYKGLFCDKECESGNWGKNCQNKCGKCDISACDRIDGVCQHGCAPGFKEQGCDRVCNIGYYGKNCSRPCSSTCAKSRSLYICNNVNGTCLNGCKAGYEGSFCEKECDDGKWGSNCSYDCGKCDKSVCNRTNGVCKQGCAPGFKTRRCTEKCDNGSYGKDCQNKCNNNCLWSGVNAICDNVDGTCLNGCKSGYRGSRCYIECDDGKWGINCTNDCGKCLTSPCNHVNGYCQDGCAVGYKKMRDCHTECDTGTYGKECKSRCSNNCFNGCDKKTGVCSDCKSGWKGERCTIECNPGRWGKQCRDVCGMCKGEEPCDRFNGTCVHGCLPGFKMTLTCEEGCEDGTYGNSCLYNCSHTCKGICNKINGTCDRCRQFWTGHFCENVSDKILSDTEAVTRCHETPKPNIALICVGILCVIIVVYATVITVLFKRKTTQNGPMVMLM